MIEYIKLLFITVIMLCVSYIVGIFSGILSGIAEILILLK